MSRLTLYAYDLSGNVVRKNLANGLKEARTHDGRNRVSTLKNQTSGGSDVAGYSYQYDRVGTVMQIVEDYPSGSLAGRTITNGYDGVYRLLTEAIATSGSGTVTTTYAYDKAHNRTSKAVSGGATTTYTLGTGSNGAGANQIISAAVSGGATTTYGYDNNGNRRTRTVSSHTDYSSYDFENRLVELDYETGGTGTGAYLYGYDYRTRRVMRTEPVGVTTNIVFNGGVSILEYTTSAASPAVEYVRGKDYGGGVGGLEYSVRSGVSSFNSYDSRGDVTTKTNGSGTVTFQTGYEAFGSQTVTSGSTLDRQKASTKEQDPTGLLNEGFRYRDPDTGTFITRDPLGFKAGINMYTYVRQNPWTHFDPEGLDDNDKKKQPIQTPTTDTQKKSATDPQTSLTSKTDSKGTTTTTASASIGVGTDKGPNVIAKVSGSKVDPLQPSNPAAPTSSTPVTPSTYTPPPPTITTSTYNVQAGVTASAPLPLVPSLRFTVGIRVQDQTNAPKEKAPSNTTPQASPQTGPISVTGTAGFQAKIGDATFSAHADQKIPVTGKQTTTLTLEGQIPIGKNVNLFGSETHDLDTGKNTFEGGLKVSF